MLNNIVLGRYYPVKSNIHTMHPLSKILCTVFFITMALICNDIRLSLLLAVLAILMTAMAHLPNNILFKTINSLKFILIFIIVINLILRVDRDTTIIMLLKIILITQYTTVLTLTTPPTEITYGLSQFLSPLKIIGIPVHKMALSISLALRFIPTIIDQGNKILKSQASRGIDYYNSGLQGKIVALKAMLFPMFRLTIKRADQLADSMEVRLYNINKKRTNFRTNKWSIFDTYMTLIHLSLLIAIIYRIIGSDLIAIFNNLFI